LIEPSAQLFRRTFGGVVVALLVLVIVFAAIGANQGPKLSSAQVDTDGVVAQSGQQLRLFANQAVATVSDDQVTISPATALTVSSSGDTIAVQFDQALKYNTEYTVHVSGVTSQYVNTPSDLQYTFRTGSPDIFYLDRGTGSDQIIRTAINETERTVVYSAPKIQDFAVFDGAVAVSTEVEDGLSALSLVNAAGDVESVALPGAGTVDLMRGNAATGVLGFTFTGAEPVAERTYFDTLITIDLNSTRLLSPVTGLDGALLEVLDWSFVPASTRLIAQNTDQSLLSVNTDEPRDVLPLGQYVEFDSVSADGSAVVVGDPFGPLALNLADGTTTRLDPSPLDGVTPFGGTAQVLEDGRWLQQVAFFNETTGRFQSLVVVDDGEASRALFRTLDDAGSIERFRVSPNNQYVAIETVPDVSVSEPDGYLINGRSTSVTTVFVDLESGAVVKSVEGFGATW
jgi:hypothetical protein